MSVASRGPRSSAPISNTRVPTPRRHLHLHGELDSGCSLFVSLREYKLEKCWAWLVTKRDTHSWRSDWALSRDGIASCHRSRAPALLPLPSARAVSLRPAQQQREQAACRKKQKTTKEKREKRLLSPEKAHKTRTLHVHPKLPECQKPLLASTLHVCQIFYSRTFRADAAQRQPGRTRVSASSRLRPPALLASTATRGLRAPAASSASSCPSISLFRCAAFSVSPSTRVRGSGVTPPCSRS